MKILTILMALFLSIVVNGQSRVKSSNDLWCQRAWEIKSEINKKLARAGMPFQTDVLTGNMPAKSIKIDVSMVDNLILYAWATTDGNGSDQAVWANARLINNAGQSVWLDELKPIKESVGYGSVTRNTNIWGSEISINGKKYKRGIAAHAESELSFALDKKYKTFEAEVGIDDATELGSVVFKIQNVIVDSYIAELQQNYGRQLIEFVNYANTSPANWLLSGNSKLERQALMNAIAELDDQSWFKQRVEMIDSQKSEAQMRGYLLLLSQVAPVLAMQKQLKMVNLAAIELFMNDMKKNSAFDSGKMKVKFDFIKENLAKVKKNIYQASVEALQAGQKIVDTKRDLLLSNPMLRDKQIVAVRRRFDSRSRSVMGGDLGVGPSNYQNNSEIWNPQSGWDNEFVRISGFVSGMKTDQIFKSQGNAILSDPEIHFNGNKMLYSSVGTNNRWHIFELDLTTGKSIQITPEAYKDFDSFDACYTPDGRIIFCATATFLGLPCTDGGNKMCGLFIFDPKTGISRQLTYDQDSNWGPVTMNNGQILYVRWEYADLPHSNSRIVFSMNPDGTTQQAVYGTNSYYPTSIWGIRPIPGHPSAFVATVSGHHSVARSGALMIFDPTVGNKEADGIVAQIPYRGKKVRPIIRDRLPDGIWPHFLTPWPLNDKYFVVAMKSDANSLWGLYLVDTFDNMTLITEQEGYAFLDPQIIEKRTTPAVIPDRIDLTKTTATIYMQDVYTGPGLKGIPRGAVKKLRIGTYSFSPMTQGGLVGMIGVDGPWDIKRIIGTVDVEADGSAMFTVPANTPIFLQPLDQEGKALQLMRSWFTAMPGETLSCIGCHEDKRSVPIPQARIASKKHPQLIKPWYGKERGFSYRHEVQPILDRACVACHDGSNSQIPYLKGDLWTKDWSSQYGGSAYMGNGGHFTESYSNLHRYVRRPGIESDMEILSPMDVHADQTELMQMLNKGHHNVKLTREEKERLSCWIDFNAPFHGRREDIPGYNSVVPWDKLKKQYASMFYAPIHDYSYLPEIPKDIKPEFPLKPELIKGDSVAANWPMYNPANGLNRAAVAHNAQIALGNFQKEIYLTDNVSLRLIKVPVGSFIMGSMRQVDETPQTTVTIARPFWIGQFEITNEIYALFDPSHDSRFEYRHGYQFGRIGYPMDKPDQPVVRISWNEAMAFCKWLSEKTGLKFTLPDEAEWEWACRSGSDTPYWFGELGADFSRYANVSDIRIRDFASCTSFKNYESSNIIDNPSRFDDWIPRDNTYDDGGFVSEPIGRYRPSPWDIYDMHGNVAEWTRSAYMPYPYNAEDGRNDIKKSMSRVARGGSWRDRPFRATSSFRLSYREYQKVYNVGFRVMMVE